MFPSAPNLPLTNQTLVLRIVNFIMYQSRLPFIILPVALPAAYLLYLSWKVTRTTSAKRGQYDSSAPDSDTDSSPGMPFSIPAEVIEDDGSRWVVSYERVVSDPVLVSNLTISEDDSDVTDERKREHPSPLIQAYSRAAHIAFSATPQARLMRIAILDDDGKRTFDARWIRELAFQKGDVVNGAYKVVYHGSGVSPRSERIELLIESPPSYRGPPAPEGLILAEIRHARTDDQGQASVVFVNETWMWRRVDHLPTMIENSVGGKIHEMLARWLVVRGVEGVTERR